MIKLELPFPPSVNSAYANGGNKRGRHKTLQYADWIKLASTAVKQSHRQGVGPYSLQIALERPDRRARDLGNYEKCLSDFLVMHGIVKDDSYCRRLTMYWAENLPAPCVVIIQGCEEGLAA